ncbi:MAG: hypothetical protein VCB25_00415, partial [Myxococcota bacterium]
MDDQPSLARRFRPSPPDHSEPLHRIAIRLKVLRWKPTLWRDPIGKIRSIMLAFITQDRGPDHRPG